jgi:uncharacterized membrane protein YgaE (UPF0421/DUF939 family)
MGRIPLRSVGAADREREGWSMTPRGRISRKRHIILSVAAGGIAGIVAIAFLGAPPVPVAVGVAIAIAVLVWRAPRA